MTNIIPCLTVYPYVFISTLRPREAYMRQQTRSLLLQAIYSVIACPLPFPATKPLPEPVQAYCQFDLSNKLQWNYNRHLTLLIHENAFKNVVGIMAAIFFGLNAWTHCGLLTLYGDIDLGQNDSGNGLVREITTRSPWDQWVNRIVQRPQASPKILPARHPFH